MDVSTSTCSCPICSLQVNLDLIYVGSTDFVKANIKEILVGPHGAHVCTGCRDRLYTQANVVEFFNHFEVCCDDCRTVARLARGDLNTYRQVTELLRARRGV